MDHTDRFVGLEDRADEVKDIAVEFVLPVEVLEELLASFIPLNHLIFNGMIRITS